jgi:hypothetical protein
MFTSSRCIRLAFLLACASSILAGAPAVRADDKTPLSPETIVAKDLVGKATVEFLVGDVYLRPSSWAVDANDHWRAVPLSIVQTGDATKERLTVLVSGEVTARLKALGIDSAQHFNGKLLRVSGSVNRTGNTYVIQVKSLDQLESIRKPN